MNQHDTEIQANEYEFDDKERENKRFEYEMAQQMLRHYDALNWQIGGILIAAVSIMTGFVLNGEFLSNAKESQALCYVITIGFPVFSLFVLIVWILWFRRHRDLYNLRNEVLYRLEVQLGMYHFLRVVEAVGSQNAAFNKASDAAKKSAKHDSETFAPIVKNELSGPSGYKLAWVLAIGVPVLQFLLLLMILTSFR